MSQVALPEVAQKRILERNQIVQQINQQLQQAKADLAADIYLCRSLQGIDDEAEIETLPDGKLVWSIADEE